MKIASFSMGLLAAGLLVSCSSSKQERELPEGVGINLSYMDTTVRPSDDFFRFVNGGWIAENEIQARSLETLPGKN